MNNHWIRFFVTVVTAFALTSCVSTSLEDAAPQAVSNEPTNLTAINQNPAPSETAVVEAQTQSTSSSITTQTSAVQAATNVQAAANEQATTVDNSVVPDKPSNEDFPTFAEDRRGEIIQMTAEERAAIEARMTEILIQREKDPRIKARYQARLVYLRRLAKTHASDTTAKIEQ